MRKSRFTPLALILVAGVGIAVASRLFTRRERALQARSVDQILALPEDEIDVGLGSLLVEKEYNPGLDIGKCVAHLDAMAIELRSRIGPDAQPEGTIAAINDYLFAELGYAALEEHESRPEDSFLHVLLGSRKGRCASLSILYLALAHRLGLPIFGVVLPGPHVFVRYVDGQTRINIETTASGRFFTDSHYLNLFPVPTTRAAKSLYMRELRKREVLALSIYDLGVAYRRQRKLGRAVAARKRSLRIIPDFVEAWRGLAVTYVEQGKTTEALAACARALRISPKDVKTRNALGLAYLQGEKLERATKVFLETLAIDPNSAMTWYHLGRAYEKGGALGEAIRAFERALEIDPNDPSPHREIAIAYYHTGKHDSAWRHVRKCHELGHKLHPGFLDALQLKMKEPEE